MTNCDIAQIEGEKGACQGILNVEASWRPAREGYIFDGGWFLPIGPWAQRSHRVFHGRPRLGKGICHSEDFSQAYEFLAAQSRKTTQGRVEGSKIDTRWGTQSSIICVLCNNVVRSTLYNILKPVSVAPYASACNLCEFFLNPSPWQRSYITKITVMD